uniref:Uncharacterized protein n=1 Tax=Oryzias melastigma TaxID=30732 RepID=A0A3B3CG17_ORYME
MCFLHPQLNSREHLYPEFAGFIQKKKKKKTPAMEDNYSPRLSELVCLSTALLSWETPTTGETCFSIFKKGKEDFVLDTEESVKQGATFISSCLMFTCLYKTEYICRFVRKKEFMNYILDSVCENHLKLEHKLSKNSHFTFSFQKLQTLHVILPYLAQCKNMKYLNHVHFTSWLLVIKETNLYF